jgi:hypothetical protein
MSFSITQQPSNTVPQPKSKHLEWLLGTTDFLNSADTYATFTITFVDGAEADALIVQVLGNSFTTESAQPFTVDSYRHEAAKEDTAANFAGMLGISPAFLDWVVTHAGGVVTATNSKPGVVSTFTFNFTALVVEPVVSSTNGTTESRKSKFVIWDLYNGSDKIVGRKSAAIDPSGVNGVCSIKFDASFLFNTYEPKTDLIFWAEDKFYLDILFKAGLINQNSVCQQDVEAVVQGDIFTLVNSIFQPTDQLGFAPYTSDIGDDGPGDPLVKWITGNPLRRYLCNDFFELAGIYLVNDGSWRAEDPFLIEFTIHIGETTETVAASPDTDSHRFFFVPIGTLNGSYSGLLETADSVDIQVFAYTDGDVKTPYSEKIVRTFSHQDCDCKEVIIYLGDLGSFDSIRFGELRALNQGVTASTRIFEPGGRDYEDQIQDVARVDTITDAQNELVYISEPINELNRGMFEQLQRSPQIYRIKQVETTSGTVSKLERLQMTRGNFVNMNRGGDKRFEGVFKSASGTKWHK